MGSGLRLMGNSVHPVLVHLPLILFPAALLLDVLGFILDGAFLLALADYTLLAGLISAIPAGLAAGVAFRRIPPSSDARSVAAAHLLLNAVAAGLFLVCWLLRQFEGGPSSSEWWGLLMVETAGVGLLIISGTLGNALASRSGGENVPDADDARLIIPRRVRGPIIHPTPMVR